MQNTSIFARQPWHTLITQPVPALLGQCLIKYVGVRFLTKKKTWQMGKLRRRCIALFSSLSLFFFSFYFGFALNNFDDKTRYAPFGPMCFLFKVDVRYENFFKRKHVYNPLEITVGPRIFSKDQRKRDVILYIAECHAKPYRAACYAGRRDYPSVSLASLRKRRNDFLIIAT